MARTLFPWETAVTTDEVDISRDLHKKTKPTISKNRSVKGFGSTEKTAYKSQESTNYLMSKIRQVLPRSRHNKSERPTIPKNAKSQDQSFAQTGSRVITASAEQQSYAEADVTMGTIEEVMLSPEYIEPMIQDETATQMSKKLSKKLPKEPEEKRLNMDIHHFRRPYVLRGPNYWFIIFKGTIASFCVALNTIHLLNIIGLFPPTFSFFKLKATSYNHAMALATSNINKLLTDRVGLVVRWMPYSEVSENETYSNCKVLINNYQWSQWTEFEKQIDQRCGIKTYIRFYNLRIIKVIQSTTAKKQVPTHCPATVQYKHTWDRACCPRGDLQPLENYFNLSYDKAFCIVNSTLRNVNASTLSTVCKTGKLWTPLPMAAFPVNNSYYQQSNIVKSYEIQHGKALESYWIGVERTDGKNWLINGQLTIFDSRFNCKNHCYSMEILLSTQAYKKYLNKKKYFVCVKNGKWELFSNDDPEKCMAVCITKASNS